ncbi:N-acetylmuramoyl-L-alanine amidase [Sutcliffiella sp. NC1]|uniref:N-acetylmuramoyl-L-alanine amidase n=1 Tax=Sutcliffiella sp. NC1 TaxID=3004096 RepID=UPI0022DDD5EC|nr:N-acetylmuramoyl-L-alanine amidase [Sutcliffiella sp. NC1]WBL14545.1 N-acetylmuramoyl-L-alanine amidase [Sutcliffiella sp. NC1]
MKIRLFLPFILLFIFPISTFAETINSQEVEKTTIHSHEEEDSNFESSLNEKDKSEADVEDGSTQFLEIESNVLEEEADIEEDITVNTTSVEKISEGNVTEIHTTINDEVSTNDTTNEIIDNHLTSDEMYLIAVNENSASKKLELFIEGYEKFPNDSRFVDGIQSSAQSLLTWARRQHNQMQFSTAIDRYERILLAPQLNSTIQKSTEKHLTYANNNKSVPSAEDLSSNASKQTTVSGIFTSYVDAYEWYPEDGRFQQGLQSSAQNLYNWAVRQHDSGNFSTAITRYETILSVNGINQTLIGSVNSSLADAKIGKRSANIILELAVNESSASRKLALYVEGYGFYPNDHRFVDGIRLSAQLLLNWARGQHNRGNFDTAIDRYNTIIQTPVLDDTLLKTTEKHIQYASTGKLYPTVEELIHNAENQGQVSAIFTGYLDALLHYSEDERILAGLQKSAKNLFVWATKQHDLGNYETAINRYELLLSASNVNQALVKDIHSRLQDALIGKRPANVILDLAQKEASASKKLDLFLEGYMFYPNNKDFYNGISTSAELVLNYATKQHQQGSFDIAISRYDFIMSIKEVLQSIKDRAQLQKHFAESNKKIPSASEYFDQAMSQSTLTVRLNTLLDGYSIYKESRQLRDGIHQTAKDLLAWASKQHESGNFSTAMNRYETIIELPTVPNNIIEETKVKLRYAKQNSKYPTAQEMYNYANNQTSASHLLTAYIEGYYLYPNDQRFVNGINNSAQSLLNWATNQQQSGNFNTAIDRYERILSAPRVKTTIVLEAEAKLSYAKNNKRIPSVNSLISEASKNSTVTGRFNILLDSYFLYPNDKKLISELNESAKSVLDWATKQHQSRNYTTALDRYNRIIQASAMEVNLISVAAIQKEYAVNKILLPRILSIATINSSTTLKTGAGESYNTIATLSKNDYVEVVAIERNGWLKVIYNNRTAFIDGEKVSVEYYRTDQKNGLLDGMVIVLDPGHGGKDPGASANGIVEKNLVLDISLRAKKLLEDQGAIVIMTRETDVFLELHERAAIANSSNADIFISVHANKFNGSANGIESFWYGKHEKNSSIKLSNSLQNALVQATGMNYRRVAEGNYHVIRETKIPSSLIEIGFLDHPNDSGKLKQAKYKQLAAEGILQGIINYFLK